VFCDTAAFIQASHLLKEAFIVMSCMIVSLSNSSDTFLNSNFGLLRSLKVEHLSTTETRSFGKISECRIIPVIDSIDIKNEDEALLFSRKLSIDVKRVKSVLKANGLMIVGLNDVGVKQKGIFAVWNEVNLACLIGFEKIITIPVSEKFMRLSKKESEFLEKKKQKDLMFLENIAGDDEIEQADHENGKPIEYIVHRALFFGLRFYVDESVLIPRRSSEALVTSAINYCKEFPSETSWNILDLGTGSGCLLLSVLSSLCGYTDPTVVSGRGIDVSEAAISTAQMNCQEMNLSSIAHFKIGDITKQEDWMSNSAQLPLNVILCNPPYSSRHETNRLSIQSKQHEPAMALFADDYDSLKMYRKLFEVLSSFERSSCENLFEENRSIFILEVGSGQLESVLSIFSPLRCWKFKDIRKDYKGMNRCVILQYQLPSS
jgi:release factor glutamine methyltransferase